MAGARRHARSRQTHLRLALPECYCFVGTIDRLTGLALACGNVGLAGACVSLTCSTWFFLRPFAYTLIYRPKRESKTHLSTNTAAMSMKGASHGDDDDDDDDDEPR